MGVGELRWQDTVSWPGIWHWAWECSYPHPILSACQKTCRHSASTRHIPWEGLLLWGQRLSEPWVLVSQEVDLCLKLALFQSPVVPGTVWSAELWISTPALLTWPCSGRMRWVTGLGDLVCTLQARLLCLRCASEPALVMVSLIVCHQHSRAQLTQGRFLVLCLYTHRSCDHKSSTGLWAQMVSTQSPC